MNDVISDSVTGTSSEDGANTGGNTNNIMASDGDATSDSNTASNNNATSYRGTAGSKGVHNNGSTKRKRGDAIASKEAHASNNNSANEWSNKMASRCNIGHNSSSDDKSTSSCDSGKISHQHEELVAVIVAPVTDVST